MDLDSDDEGRSWATDYESGEDAPSARPADEYRPEPTASWLKSLVPDLRTSVTYSDNRSRISVHIELPLEVGRNLDKKQRLRLYPYKRGPGTGRGDMRHHKVNPDGCMDSQGRQLYTVARKSDEGGTLSASRALHKATAASSHLFEWEKVALDTSKITAGWPSESQNGLHVGTFIYVCRPDDVKAVEEAMTKKGLKILDSVSEDATQLAVPSQVGGSH